MTGNGSPWVVVRVDGEALADVTTWPRLAAALLAGRERGERTLVVCAPLPGLEGEALLAALGEGGHEAVLRDLADRLQRLGVPLDEPPPEGTQELLGELGRTLAGAHLLGEAGPRARARLAAMAGALPVPLLAAWLRRIGIEATAVDPRELLAAVEAGDEGRAASSPPRVAADVDAERRFLAADCPEQAPPELGRRLRELPAIVVTAGGPARGADGGPVILEGGADRAAACLAAQLSALRCEAWGTAPGLFTADPRVVPSARLLRSLAYEEAVELLTTGARGFHPRGVGPLRRAGLPLRFRAAGAPEVEGTEVSAHGGGSTPRVKAVAHRGGVMLLSLETAGMWQRVGFLADVFARIARHGLSVDLVSTAEANVTVSFDAAPGPVDTERLAALAAELAPFGRARVLGPCAAVTLVGRQIRSILHRLGPLLEAFEEQPVHLLTQAATDLNLTFVVDEEQSLRLVRELHELLLRRQGEDEVLGPTWEELRGGGEGGAQAAAGEGDTVGAPAAWWRRKREALLAVAAEQSPVYVYDRESLLEAAAQLASLATLDRVLYSVKANPHAGVLRVFAEAGLGFECVSPGELEHLFQLFPDLEPERVLFTPNFAPRGEYDDAFARGVRVTLDNLWPLQRWPETFAGRELFLRLDPGHGRGHHRHVRTAGTHSKFGIPLDELEETAEVLRRAGARVAGLHAHAGSGILDPEAWREVATRLLQAAEHFPDVEVLDLGGGLGVGELPHDRPLDLGRLDAALAEVKAAFPRYRLWLEPGRFLVARAGVLLARVTQLKGKGDSRYVGVDTGMNSLIRPALYGAYHEIVNLTRLDEPPSQVADVVGPICESGDVLGAGRRLPATEEGDVLLVAHAGAYGRAMSSWYNLREPAAERLLE